MSRRHLARNSECHAQYSTVATTDGVDALASSCQDQAGIECVEGIEDEQPRLKGKAKAKSKQVQKGEGWRKDRKRTEFGLAGPVSTAL